MVHMHRPFTLAHKPHSLMPMPAHTRAQSLRCQSNPAFWLRVVKTVFLERFTFYPLNQGVVLLRPGKWRKWRKSPGQNHRLPKTPFSPPWLTESTDWNWWQLIEIDRHLFLPSNLKHGWFTQKFTNHIWTTWFVWTFLRVSEAKSSYAQGGSDVVRELSREPAMFQIGLWGKVLNWLKLTENNRKSTEVDWKSRRLWGKLLKLPKIGFRDFAWKVGRKAHGPNHWLSSLAGPLRKFEHVPIIVCSQASAGTQASIRARQRSAKGVVRRNGCPKGCFWRVRFLSVLFRFALKIQGAEKKRTLQKHPFGQPFRCTTPSLLLRRRIGNGGGKQGCGNCPRVTIGTRYGNSASTAWMPPKPTTNLAWSDSPLQRTKERSRYGISVSTPIVDTDIDCGRRFCGPRFRES